MEGTGKTHGSAIPGARFGFFKALQQFAAGLKGEPPVRVGILCSPWQFDHYRKSNLPDYVAAVRAGGGKPKLIPTPREETPPAEILRNIHALLIPGGIDVDPSMYGQENRHAEETDLNFDKFERDCIVHALETRMPMLGVCRGLQLMNVAAGGTLIQDINKEAHRPAGMEIEHRQWKIMAMGGDIVRPSHGVTVEPTINGRASILRQLFGMDFLFVNSAHHQAIGVIAPIFAVAAFAYDGIIEAIERTDCPSQWGVQWHPERQRLMEPAWSRVFRKLVRNGRVWRDGKESEPDATEERPAFPNHIVLNAREAERRSAAMKLPGNLGERMIRWAPDPQTARDNPRGYIPVEKSQGGK